MLQDDTYWSRVRNRRFSRRAILRGGAAGLVGVAGFSLLACGSTKKSASQPAAGAASQQPQAGGTLNAYNNINLGPLDPHFGAGNSSNIVLDAVYSRPFQYKSGTTADTFLKYEIEGDAISSAESPDGQTWTMKLQPKARFHNIAPVNGHAVESADIKATFTRAFSIPQNSFKSLIPMIDPAQIETPAPDTVVFKLKYAYGPFRETLAGSGVWVMPREALAGSYDPAKVTIGSGPFTLDSYTPDVALMLKKNPTWFRSGLPYVDSVRGAIIPDAAQQIAQFTGGNLDELHPAPNDLSTVKQNNPKATVLSQPYSNAYAFFGHMNDAASPFRDIRVRQALSMAVDRATLKKVIFNSQYTDNQIIPAAVGKWMLPVDKFGDAAQYYEYKPDEVKKLLQATAGGPQLTRFLSPVKNYGPAFDQLAETVVSMLNAAGFKIRLVPIDYNKDFIGGGKGALYGAYPADALLFSVDTVFANAEETLSAHFGSASARNKPQVKDSDLDQKISKMESMLDDNARLQAALDIQKYLAGMIYQISTPSEVLYTVLQPSVHDYNLSQTEPSAAFPRLWLRR